MLAIGVVGCGLCSPQEDTGVQVVVEVFVADELATVAPIWLDRSYCQRRARRPLHQPRKFCLAQARHAGQDHERLCAYGGDEGRDLPRLVYETRLICESDQGGDLCVEPTAFTTTATSARQVGRRNSRTGARVHRHHGAPKMTARSAPVSPT